MVLRPRRTFERAIPSFSSSATSISRFIEGEYNSKPLLQTLFFEGSPAISPDGRWIAYRSNETGQQEIYVRPFPNVEEGKWQISSGGGNVPVWGPEGQELFYRAGEEWLEMMVVPYETEPRFTHRTPKILFTGRYFSAGGRHYDIFSDGQRFLMMKEVEQTEETSTPQELIVVLNWFQELKRLVPTGE